MAIPNYVASGTANGGSATPRTPGHPAGLAANDRLILQVFIRATDENATCTTPSGWTFEFEDDITGFGSQFIFSKKATGSESGTLSVAWTGTGTGPCSLAQIHAFRGVTTAARWFEPGDFGTAVGGTTSNIPIVVSTGTDRLGVSLLAAARDATVTAATGETGGDWTEALAEVTTATGGGATLQLQIADMATATVISGGTGTFGTTVGGHAVHNMALIATGGTLSCSAPIFVHEAETTASASITSPGSFTAPANNIVLLHVVAKDDTAAVTAFANVPTDAEGGSPWTLVHQQVSGTGPALRTAVFKRLIGATSVQISSISFTASSTPDSLSTEVFTIAGGDGSSLQSKSGTGTSGDAAATLDSAPAADSTVMAFFGTRGVPGLGATPTGFTLLHNDTVPTHHRYGACYDAVSPVQTASFDTVGSGESVVILVEIPQAAAAATVTGTGARTLASLAGAGVGVHGVTGTGVRTVAPIGAAVGIHAPPISGTGARTLGALDGFGAGVFGVKGTGARTLAALTGAAVGTVSSTSVTGTGAVTLATLTGVGVGTHTAPTLTTGTGARTLDALTGVATGSFGSVLISDATIFAGTGNSTTGTTHTSGAFTPSPNGLVLAYGSARKATIGAPGTIGLVGSALSFTKLVEDTTTAVGPTARMALFWAQAGPTPVSMTVTVTSTGADRTASNILEIAANYSATITNYATGINDAGDPTAVLPNAPAISSEVVAAALFAPSDTTGITHPFGTELTDFSSQPTMGRNICFKNGSAPTSASWTTGGGSSVAILVEIGAAGAPAVTGTGARTLAGLTATAAATHIPYIGIGIGQVGPATVEPWSDGTLWTDGTGWAGSAATVVAAATGVHGVTATAASILAPLVGAAVAGLGAIGTAARTLAPLTGNAVGTHISFVGTGARTLPALVGAATGTFSFTGTGARTLAPLTGVATGVHGVVGTAARILLLPDGFATGTHAQFVGTGARTLAPLAGAATAVHGVVGTASRTLTPLAGSATGFFSSVGGTGVGILPPLVGAAVGIHGLVTTGTGARILPPLDGEALGSFGSGAVVFGTGARTLPPPTGVASGVHGVTGTGSRTLTLTGAAAGVHGVVGTGARVLTPLAGAAVGVHGSVTGTGARILAALTGVASGVHGVVGTAARTLASLTGTATAFHGSAFTGTAAITLAPLTGAATAVHGVAGTAARTLLAITGVATGKHAVIGTGARTLAPITGAATGSHTVTFGGAGARTMPALQGISLGVHGVVGTGTGIVLPLEGHGFTFAGIMAFGTGAIDLQTMSGFAIGNFDTPPTALRYQDCQITGFKLTKENARYDRERRAYVLEDVYEDPEPPPRRPPTTQRLRR